MKECIHDFHQIVLGLNGYVDFQIEGEFYTVNTAKGCILPANVTHFCRGYRGGKLLTVNIEVADKLSKPDPRVLPLFSNRMDLFGPTRYIHDTQQVFRSVRYFEVNDNFRRLYNCCANEISRLSNEQLAQCISAMIFYSVSAHVTVIKPHGEPHHRLNIEKLRHWISLNLSGKITVSSMAEVMCMSVSHFHACFVAFTQKTPHQFLVEIRLEYALDQVRNTNLPFSCIADEAGFSSQAAMTNTFRKHLGNSPSQLRKHYANTFYR